MVLVMALVADPLVMVLVTVLIMMLADRSWYWSSRCLLSMVLVMVMTTDLGADHGVDGCPWCWSRCLLIMVLVMAGHGAGHGVTDGPDVVAGHGADHGAGRGVGHDAGRGVVAGHGGVAGHGVTAGPGVVADHGVTAGHGNGYGVVAGRSGC